MLETIFVIVFLLSILFCCFILLRYFRSEYKRAEERHNTFIESLKSLSHSFKEIQIDIQNGVGQYIKNSEYK